MNIPYAPQIFLILYFMASYGLPYVFKSLKTTSFSILRIVVLWAGIYFLRGSTLAIEQTKYAILTLIGALAAACVIEALGWGKKIRSFIKK